VSKQISEKSEKLFRDQLLQRDQQITDLQNKLENIALSSLTA
jgi:hypothetical protein